MITRVRAENLFSWKSLDFKVQKGVTLLDGWNEDDQSSEGSGKSSIPNIQSWVLYGKVPKDINIEDVIRYGEKSGYGEVYFDDKVKIIRSRKPNLLDFLKLQKDGSWVSCKGKDAKETQSIIEEYIGFSFETFCQTIYFSQNAPKKFIESNQEEKAKILSEIQDLQIFDKARKQVSDLLKLEESKLVDLKHQNQLLLSELQKLKTQEELETLKIKNLTDEFVLQKNFILNQITECEKSEENWDLEVTKLTTDLKSLENANFETIDLETRIAELEDAKKGLIQLKVDFQSNKLRRQRLNKQAEELAESYKKLEREKNALHIFCQNPTSECPSCGSVIHTDDLSEQHDRLKVLNDHIEHIKKEFEVLAPELSQTETDNLADIDSGLEKLEVELQPLKLKQKESSELSHKIKEIEINIRTLKNLIEKSVSNRGNLNNKINTLPPPDLKVPLHNLEIIKKDILLKEDSTSNLIELVRESEKYLTYLNELRTGFKDIKSFIFNNVLNEVNYKINNYLEKLFDIPITLKFVNNSMKIDTQIKFNGIDTKLGLLSGGQFRRVALATDLALSDTAIQRKGAKFEMLILDEYFKDLSENSMTKCLHLLEERDMPILLIEHNSVFKNIVTNIFQVILNKGISSVKI